MSVSVSLSFLKGSIIKNQARDCDGIFEGVGVLIVYSEVRVGVESLILGINKGCGVLKSDF